MAIKEVGLILLLLPAIELLVECTTSGNDRRASSTGRGQAEQSDRASLASSGPRLKIALESDPKEARYDLDEKTQIIYIDKSNDSGYLVSDNFFASSDQDEKVESVEGGSPSNFSVYLLSQIKEHIAILLDVEQINFEPSVNCESQEIRFSIVGEISKQLLSKRSGTNQTQQSDISSSDPSPEESASKLPPTSQANPNPSTNYDSSSAPPMPISEAMVLLLNSPLNKTILDESVETNDFKIIDSTIDYLLEETCHELSNSSSPDHILDSNRRLERQTSEPKDTRGGERNLRRHGQRIPPRRLRGRKKQRKQTSSNCSHESSQFKILMTSKLNEHFEWDDFKVVCGKIRQLVVPMRSLKISLYSDEFAPSSNFTIRYKFVSDPSLLPAYDNGFYFCRNRKVIDLSLKCDGFDDCGDASDESIKICGYPSGKPSASESLFSAAKSRSSRLANGQISRRTYPNPAEVRPTSSNMSDSHNLGSVSNNKKKLTYINGDLLHCCQSNDWLNFMPQNRANHVTSLQSLIGESMSLFSGPLFAPTKKGLHRVKRIVGGSIAPKDTWPGQVSLQYELLEPLCHFCAGTLIHPLYVLTAGHCITKDGLSRGIKVVLGAHDLRQLNTSQVQERYVDDALIYPGVDVKHLSYDWENDMNNDIALLRLNAPVIINSHVAPACLPPYNTPLPINTTCRSIGWGQTHGSGSSNLLKHLNLKVVNSTLCSKELFDKEDGSDSATSRAKPRQLQKSLGGSGGKVMREYETAALEQYSDQTMVCVNNDFGHGICQGDSGGPLYCDRVTSTGEVCTEIYGVASFIIQYATVGAMCAVENLPGIFGEVSSKTEWITSSMKMFEQSYRLKYS